MEAKATEVDERELIDKDRLERLNRLEGQYFGISKVKSMDELKTWMDETCATFKTTARNGDQGFFLVKSSDLQDELQRISLAGFEQQYVLNDFFKQINVLSGLISATQKKTTHFVSAVLFILLLNKLESI